MAYSLHAYHLEVIVETVSTCISTSERAYQYSVVEDSMGYLHCHLDSDLYWVVSGAYVHFVFHFTIIQSKPRHHEGKQGLFM